MGSDKAIDPDFLKSYILVQIPTLFPRHNSR